MNEMVKQLLASLIRKIVFGAGAIYVAWLVEKGVATTGDVERFIEIAVAILLLAVPALWTTIKNWLKKNS